MNPAGKKPPKSALAVIEEATCLLRSSANKLLFSYYLGSIPFVLGFLYFCLDMSRSARAHEYSAAAALGMAVLFIWMKYWHTVFAFRVRCELTGENGAKWPPEKVLSILATQTLIQSTRFVVLPIAAFLMVPFGFSYAFYQNATACSDGEARNLQSTFKWAWRQARLWPMQNHVLIGIFWIFGIVVLINVSTSLFFFPQLIKTLLGNESAFTLSGIRLILNPIFWVAMLGVTYLLLDPIIKTAYVLRCFYGVALESGEDLKADLKRLTRHTKSTLLCLLIFIACAMPSAVGAQEQSWISSQELDQSIEEVINRREYTWRLPKDAVRVEVRESQGPIEAALQWLIKMFVAGVRTLKDWVTKFYDWLEGLLPESENRADSTKSDWVGSVRLALTALMILLAAFLVFVFIRIWKRRQKTDRSEVRAAEVSMPDLNDEGIRADDLPADRWLALAEELSKKRDLRLAMRALYLATLAYLAQQEMITPEIYKSNREYEKELQQRAYEKQEMCDVFSKSLNVFESVWFGMHRITPAEFDQFAADQKGIRAIVEK